MSGWSKEYPPTPPKSNNDSDTFFDFLFWFVVGVLTYKIMNP